MSAAKGSAPGDDAHTAFVHKALECLLSPEPLRALLLRAARQWVMANESMSSKNLVVHHSRR